MFLRFFALLSILSVLMVPVFAQHALVSTAVQGKLVVVYRNGVVPADADTLLERTKMHVHLRRLGLSVVTLAPRDEMRERALLARSPEVLTVLSDRIVQGHMAVPTVRQQITARSGTSDDVVFLPSQTGLRVPGPIHLPRMPIVSLPRPVLTLDDLGYVSPAGWAVRSAGGYGDGVSGGPTTGPWNISMGAGVRIAILDSGVDATHPDLAQNVALNISEVDQAALPSACDDGSPQDQEGHGTWAASLAAAATGRGTGEMIGVAPQTTLLNIKVLERMPGAGSSLTTQCEVGQPEGLLSWVLAGINDAVAQHANVISLSLGTLVDLSTGDGAGWKAVFDRATYAATQAGVVIVAAAGNDGMDLSGGQYVELPAQARDVLAVTAATNPACAENLTPGASCEPGPVTRPYYSNYGGSALNAIAAPGGSYPEGPDNGVSGWIRGACSGGISNTLDGLPANGESFGCFGLGHVAYVQAMGTSAAAPLVAGAAAILHVARPDWSAEQIVAALRASATKLPKMDEPELNLTGALAMQ